MIKKIKLGKQCNLLICKDKKIKNIGMEFYFKMPYRYQDITAFNVLGIILQNSCLQFPTMLEMNRKKEELYGFSYHFSFSTYFQRETLSLKALTINPKYLDNQDLLENIFYFLNQVIYEPNLINSHFEENLFQIACMNILEEIETYNDQKSDFVQHKLLEKIGDSKDALAAPLCGDKKCLQKLTPENLVKYYQKLKSAPFDLYVVGDVSYSEIEKYVRKYFSYHHKKSGRGDYFTYIDDKKIEPETIKMTVNQTKLGVIYTLPYHFLDEKQYAARYFNYLLGGSITSKLAKEVREKQGLCYSIYSSYNTTYGFIQILTGIQEKNVDKVLKEIENQIHHLALGQISDEELNNAKETFLSDLLTIQDDIFAKIRIIQRYRLVDDDFQLENLRQNYESITKEDIMDVAKKVVYKTHVVLTGEK